MLDKSFSLQQIQKMLWQIYHKRNLQLYSSAELLLHVFEEASVVAESFRKEDGDETNTAIARLFGWLIAFINDQNVDWAKTAFWKYQGLCPYCGRKENCVCISVETKPACWHRNPNGSMPKTLNEWQKMFDRIYGNVNKVAGRERCWLHVEEELGEISRAHRLNKRKLMLGEIADAFAWLVAFCNRSGINISHTIISTYPFRCDVCAQEKCKCPKV